MQIIADRRALHQIPELDRQLPETMAYLRNALSSLKCRCFSPTESALCAFFDFGADHAIAFRSDADALPICERTALPFASQHPGCMHACGHDGHMAIALELARRLDKTATLPHNVLLVFQPAEETTGGAKDICRSGVFQDYHVEAIFGLHLWPELPAGIIGSRRLEMMSRSCELHVEITGRSSHIAKAEDGIDALAAGVQFYTRVQALERSLPDGVFRLCKFGRMESGTVCNAISGHTYLAGSLRAFQDEVFQKLRDGIDEIGRQVAAETGCQVDIRSTDGYPAVMNPPQLYDRLRTIADFTELEKPAMIAEDFSWYQQTLPGVFFFLGVGPSPALHADNFDFDETVLEKGAAFLENIAQRYGEIAQCKTE